MKRAGQWLTWIGAILLVGALAGGVTLAVSGFRSLAAFDSEAVAVSGPDNSIEHRFDAGERIQLYTRGANGVYLGPVPSCEITGPAPVEAGRGARSSVTVGAQSWISFAEYRFTESGVYRITCDQSGVRVAPAVSAMGLVGGVGGVFLAVFGGAIGFVVLVTGIVLWVLGSRRRSGPPHPGGGPQASYPPGGPPPHPPTGPAPYPPAGPATSYPPGAAPPPDPPRPGSAEPR